jgi:hypothetical protein
MLKQEPLPAAVPARMTGLSYKTYRKDRLLAAVEAREFLIRPRSLWGFRMKPYQEAVLRDVRVTLYGGDLPDDLSPVHWFPAVEGDQSRREPPGQAVPAPESGRGFITRGLLERVTIDVTRSGHRILTVDAARGTIDLKRQRLALSGVVINQPQLHRVIRGPAAVWDQATQMVTVPEYVMETGARTISGQGLRIAVDGS